MPYEMSITRRKKRKPQPGEPEPTEDSSVSEKLIQLAPKLLIGGVAALYGYVLLDTVRQVIVAQNTFIQDG